MTTGAADGAGSSSTAGSSSSAAEEATRLFEAVQQWARRTAGEGRAASDAWTEHIATGSAECRLCPLCQAIALLREARPEVALHLTEAASSLLAALRSALLAHEQEWTARRSAGVERIDIG